MGNNGKYLLGHWTGFLIAGDNGKQWKISAWALNTIHQLAIFEYNKPILHDRYGK
jgi:hypothetical protein